MNQPDLFEVGASATPAAASQAAQGAAAECSAEALQTVDVKTLRRLCLEEFERRPGGATADEVCKAVRWRFTGAVLPDELSIRPRVTELKKEGILVETSQRRYNRKMHTCTVLVHVKFKGGQ